MRADSRQPWWQRAWLVALVTGVAVAGVVMTTQWFGIASMTPAPTNAVDLRRLALLWAVLAGIAASVPAYYKAKWDLARFRAEFHAENDRANTATKLQLELAAILWAAADAHESVVAAIVDPSRNREQAVGQAIHTSVELAVRTAALSQPPGTRTRAALLARGSGGWEVADVAGLPLTLADRADSDFDVAAIRLMRSRDPVNTTRDDATQLALPGDADVVVRIPVSLGPQQHGLLAVDLWDTRPLGKVDIYALQAIAKLLAATLTAADLQE